MENVASWTSRASLDEAIATLEEGQPTPVGHPLGYAFRVNRILLSRSGTDFAIQRLERANGASERPDSVLARWRQSAHEALRGGDVTDVRSADAYIRAVFNGEMTDEYGTAAELFIILLEGADSDLSAEETAILGRHLEQMVFLLPASVREQALNESSHSEYPAVDEENGGADVLAAWWRSQDPRPATPQNERVIEHLERVVHATEAYGYERDPRGFDDRGEIYVRFGPPTRQTEVDFYTREMLDKIQELRRAMGNGLTVRPSEFADNEFWLYERGGQPHYYLFVDDGNAYQLGEVADLIPARLRSGVDHATGRGGAKADIILEALRAAYRQLATYHIHFGPRYNSLADYLGRFEEIKTSRERRSGRDFYTIDKRSDNSALMREEDMTHAPGDSPDAFAKQALSEGRATDRRNAYRQEQRTPELISNTLDDMDTLPVVARTARFLEEDGTTRTEVYWGIAAHEAPLPHPNGDAADHLLVNLTVHRMDDQYQTEARNEKQYLVPGALDEGGVLLTSQHASVTGSTGRYHLGMQWDQYTIADGANGTIRADRHVREGTVQLDSLDALSSDESHLEMSDLVPLLVDEEEFAYPDEEGYMGTPYPFGSIEADMPLGLYFEVYHLMFDDQDGTRFSVEYEVERRTERGGLARLFRSDEVQRSITEAEYEGRSRTAREHIMLDLSDWSGENNLRVTVRVTDEVTGQQQERVLELDAVM